MPDTSEAKMVMIATLLDQSRRHNKDFSSSYVFSHADIFKVSTLPFF